MTHHATDSTLLTWALTAVSRGALLRVSPALAQTVRLREPGIFESAFDKIGHVFFSRSANPWRHSTLAGKSNSSSQVSMSQGVSANEQNGGCGICRGAHYELGASCSGQEYL